MESSVIVCVCCCSGTWVTSDSDREKERKREGDLFMQRPSAEVALATSMEEATTRRNRIHEALLDAREEQVWRCVGWK